VASLDQPHWETISPQMRQIIEFVGGRPFTDRFYLAGGTALALQLGHRVSIDLDFFSETDELEQPSRQEIIGALSQQFPLEVDEGGLASLLINVRGSYVGFFGYSYPLLAAPHTLEGIKVAGLLDIGLMKMDALAGRGSRKDFYDLYFIAQRMPLEEILARGQDKYPYVRDFGMMVLTAMVDFTIAEKQADIYTAPNVDWSVVKNYFVQEARRIGRSWFE
jgi:hypothetical protein